MTRTVLRRTGALAKIAEIAAIAGAVTALAAAPAAQGAEAASETAPWEGPAFSATPAALLRAAARVTAPAGLETLVLFDEARYRFEADGRERFELRRIFKVTSATGATDWGTLGISWSPWFQDKPTLRARVVTPDGKAHVLDPKTVEVLAEDQSDNQVLSDRRMVRAPLPAMTVGAVVEEVVALVDQTPQFGAGLVETQALGLYGARVERQRIVISAPASVPVRTAVDLFPGLRPVEVRHGADVELTFETGPIDPIEAPPPGWPPDRPARPLITISTGATWAAVADAYARLVDPQRVADPTLKAAVRDALAAPAASPAASPATNPGTKKDDARRDTIVRILERLQRDVRYTGVELGDASIVPRTPAEVLARRYGDCKDKALLLVALLGEAGIEAHLALLRASLMTDVNPSLPGFGAFNHAIVFIPGARPLWIDATARFAPLGMLPRGDQGRLALIIARDTRALVRTPSDAPDDNRVIETRELHLPDLGKARVVETTEAWGTPAERYRSNYADADPKKVREELEKYARETYQTEALASYKVSDPYVVGGPFRIQMEATGAAVAQVYEGGATITLPCGLLLSRLPDDLRETEGANPSSDTGDKQADKTGKDAKKRSEDYLLPEPFVQEWRYRLIPPPGMTAGQLPTAETVALGPARLTKTFSREAEGAVLATFRFDTVKGRYTAADIEALRGGIGKLFKGDASVVRFEQVGLSHLDAGRITAAIGEFRRLRERDPSKTIHGAHLAQALLRAGLGEAARAAIREAIARDPKSARAHVIQGWILQHDLVGRRFKTGSDLAGAEAAYRKAKELDPGDSGARADLAILYEFWPAGVQRGPRARLAEAITEWRALPDAELTRFRDNLILDLVVTERWKELRALARPWPSTPVRDAALLAAIAAQEGTRAALDEVPRLVPDTSARPAALQSAGAYMMLRRRYPEAAALFSEAASGRGPEVRTLAEMLQRMRRRETVTLKDQPPDAVVRTFTVETLAAAQERSVTRLRPLMSEEMWGSDGPAAEQAFLTAADNALESKAVASLTPPVLADMVASLDEVLRNAFVRDGNDQIGYRFRTVGDQAVKSTLFIAKRDGKFKIVAVGQLPSTLGRQSLRALAAGDREAARRWIDWAYDQQPSPEDDPLSGGPLVRLWSRSSLAEDHAIEIAAAAIISAAAIDPHSIEVLVACRAAPRTEDQRIGCAAVLARAYLEQKRFAEALPIVEDLEKTLPQSPRAFEMHAAALYGLNRYRDLRALAEARTRRLPGDLAALRWSARGAVAAGDGAAGERAYRAAAGRPDAGATDFNELAWMVLFTGRAVGDVELEAARQAVSRSQRKEATCLHTLATLDAEAGRAEESAATLLESLSARHAVEPAPYDWYVVGRNAEQLGLPDAAMAAYRRVTPNPGVPENMDTATLARRRLARLESHAPAGKPQPTGPK